MTREALEEFKEIYKERFGEELEEKEALERALRLLNLYKVVLELPSKPVKEDENNLKICQRIITKK